MSAIDVNRALAYLTRTPRVLALLKGLGLAPDHVAAGSLEWRQMIRAIENDRVAVETAAAEEREACAAIARAEAHATRQRFGMVEGNELSADRAAVAILARTP